MSVLKSTLQGRVLTLAINRPEKKNTLTKEVLESIQEKISANKEGSVIIFEGEGGFFCAGADVSAFLEMDRKEANYFSSRGNQLMDSIQNADFISIAAIKGGAYGGGMELALSCDIRISTPDAKLGLTEINLGIFPGFGGLKRVREIGGRGLARYMGLTGKVFTGREAYELGLITLLSDDPEKEAADLANTISNKNIHAIKRIKKLISQDIYSSEYEAKLFGEVVESAEAKEAVKKFLKR